MSIDVSALRLIPDTSMHYLDTTDIDIMMDRLFGELDGFDWLVQTLDNFNASAPNFQPTVNEVSNIGSNTVTATILSISAELRQKIFKLLFKNAKMTFLPRARNNLAARIRRGQSDVFQKENMPVNVLLTCKKLYHEGVGVLFEELSLIENCGAINLHEIVSYQTRLSLRSIWGTDIARMYVGAAFANLRIAGITGKYRVSAVLMNHLNTDKDPSAMWQRTIPCLTSHSPSDANIRKIKSDPRLSNIFYLGKYNFMKCEKQVPVDPLDLSLGMLSYGKCDCKHDSHGHLYIDFVNERAIFDEADKEGHDLSVKKLQKLSQK